MKNKTKKTKKMTEKQVEAMTKTFYKDYIKSNLTAATKGGEDVVEVDFSLVRSGYPPRDKLMIARQLALWDGALLKLGPRFYTVKVVDELTVELWNDQVLARLVLSRTTIKL